MKRLCIVTDAWEPQTNGVVTTLKAVIEHLPELGYQVRTIHSGEFATMPLPSYRDIRLARNPWKLVQIIEQYRPDTVHIATEGPLGLWARNLLRRRHVPFTTSLHTKFPEYVHQRVALPLPVGYSFLRWFHGPARAVLCTTESHRQELTRWGLRNLVVWGRGVDPSRFRPLAPGARTPRTRPRLLYVGRIAVEKNLEAFLELDIDADKIVVGDGPARAALMRRYPQARWRGLRHGDELVREYADADVLVFPSLTDTFGLVMLEAMACGTPVAAYPVTGPRDVVEQHVTGYVDLDLERAVRQALILDRGRCRQWVERHASWRQVAERFAEQLEVLDAAHRRIAA